VSDIYRDPLAGLRSQIATKRSIAIEREAELDELRSALLTAETREELARQKARALDDEAMGDAADLDSLGELEREVDEWLDGLASAVHITNLRLATPVELPPPSAFAGEEGAGEAILELLVAELADVGRCEADGWYGWLTDGGARALVLVEVSAEVLDDTATHGGTLTLTLRTPMADVGALRIEPKPNMAAYQARIRTPERSSPVALLELAMGAATLLGVLPKAKMRSVNPDYEPTFEEAFTCSADHPAVVALLVDEVVREALLDLECLSVLELPAQRAFPNVVVAPPLVEVQWTRPWRGADTALHLAVAQRIARAFQERIDATLLGRRTAQGR
jgi:hypothetical protein